MADILRPRIAGADSPDLLAPPSDPYARLAVLARMMISAYSIQVVADRELEAWCDHSDDEEFLSLVHNPISDAWSAAQDALEAELDRLGKTGCIIDGHVCLRREYNVQEGYNTIEPSRIVHL